MAPVPFRILWTERREGIAPQEKGALLKPGRRFPPPWTVEDHNDACFIVKDHGGHAIAYVYFEEEPGTSVGGKSHDKG